MAEAPEHAAALPADATRIDMLRTFQRLRLRDRQLLWLAHVEGANYHEIANVLDLTEASVRVLPSRTRDSSTVTETNIHYPTDSSLLGDGVRVLDHASTNTHAHS